MKFFFSEYMLWLSGIPLYGLLTLNMFRSGEYQRARVFSLWNLEMFVSAVLLFFVSRTGVKAFYTISFWFLTFTELGLQVGVALEFTALSLRRHKIWAIRAKMFLVVGTALSLLLTFGLVSKAQPAVHDILDTFFVRAELFSSLLTFFLAFFTIVTSELQGTLWDRTDLQRFYGFLVFTIISALTDSLHVYWRTANSFSALETIRMLSSQLILIYWLVIIRVKNRARSTNSHSLIESLESVYKA